MIIIYVTFPNLKEAKKVSENLLNKKLIACANFLPIESSYLWKGKVENSKEIAALLKTKESNWNKVKEEVKRLHSYDVPCMIKLNVDANKEFNSWIKEQTI